MVSTCQNCGADFAEVGYMHRCIKPPKIKRKELKAKIAELQEAVDTYEHLSRLKNDTIAKLDSKVKHLEMYKAQAEQLADDNIVLGKRNKELEKALDTLGYEFSNGLLFNKHRLG